MIYLTIKKSFFGLIGCLPLLCLNSVQAQISLTVGNYSVFYGGQNVTASAVLPGTSLAVSVNINNSNGHVGCSNAGVYQYPDIPVLYTGSAYVGTQTTAVSCTVTYQNPYQSYTTPTITFPIVTTILDPAYQIVSILYAPPGNKSSDGYTNGTTNGTTSSIGSSFTSAQSMSFQAGSLTNTLGDSTTTSSTQAFQETLTDATGYQIVSSLANPNAINHKLEEFLIWLDPQLTVYWNGSSPGAYSLGLAPLSNNTIPQQPDIVPVAAVDMEANASGNSSVPIQYLKPQPIGSAVDGVQPYGAGLAAICANQTYYPNNCDADPNGQCGCMPSDFQTILREDPLLYSNGTNNPISPYPGTVSPLMADYSGTAACSLPTSDDDCRYVPVPVQAGSVTPVYAQLTGPGCSTCDSTPNMFTQTDSTTRTQTMGTSSSQSQGQTYSVHVSVFGFPISFSTGDTLTYTETESTGLINGRSNVLTVTLNSATIGCEEDVNIYEDTVFHTLVFQEPTGNNSCP